ncbi:MAG: site-2 protease family protein [Candidatus Hydrothermia bacterium]
MSMKILWGELLFDFFIIATIAMYTNTLCHEWGHSLTATVFGVKSHPFDIHYTPFLFGIDEKVNYDKVAELPAWQGVAIAAAGPVVNFLFACLSLIFLLRFRWPSTIGHRTLLFFLYSLAFFSIGGWFNYTIIRGIVPRGDIANIVSFGSIPSWAIWLPGIITSIIFLLLFFGPASVKFCQTFNLMGKKAQLVEVVIVASFFLMYQGSVIYNYLFKY